MKSSWHRCFFNHLKLLGTVSSFGLILCLTGSVYGQSDSWKTDAAGNWSGTTNWVGGTPPGTGGVATFGDSFGLSASRTITNDANPTLSGMTFDTNFLYTVSGGTSISLNAGSPFNLNVIRSNGITPTSLGVGHIISSVLSGSTTAFNKTGNGIVTLSGSNTFTASGGVNVLGGEVRATTGDAAFGATSNGISINGGGIRLSSLALTTNRAFTIGSSGGTVNSLVGVSTLNGTLSGTGQLKLLGSGMTIGGNSTNFTGAIQSESGTLQLSGANSALGGNASMDISGTLTLTNTTNNNANRIADNRAITLRGSQISFSGNATGTSEQIGQLNLTNGGSTITVTSTTAGSTLAFTGLSRQDRATAFFRGTNLGGTTSPTSQLVFNTSPGTLFGGGGSPAAGNTNISILSFATGSRSATGTTPDFVSWDSTTGRIYVLEASNYTTLAAATASSNVDSTGGTVASGGQVINALRLGGTLNGGATDVLTVSSGAMIFSAASTVNANIKFGTDSSPAEGILHSNFASTINGTMSGTNGFTKGGSGSLTLRGLSDYSGTTTINGGQVTMNGTVGIGVNSVFGNDSSAIVLNSNASASGSSLTTRIWTDGDVVTTFNRGFIINGGGSSVVGIGTIGGNESIIINGNIQINNPNGTLGGAFLTFEAEPLVANSVTVNGVISGSGGIRDAFSSYNILNGNNTYSGGTNMSTGFYQLGHNNALGTGTVWTSGAANILASGGPKTIANSLSLNNGTLNILGTDSLTFTGTTFLNGTQHNFNVANSPMVAELAGVVSAGSVLKSGAGTLILSNSGNSYTGSTTVRNGTLVLGGNALYGSGVAGTNPNTTFGSAGTLFVGDASTLAADNVSLLTNGAFTIDRSIQVSGVNTTGTTTLGGSNTSGNAVFNGRIDLNRASTNFTAAAGGTVTINGQITQTSSAALNKVGSGSLILTSSNTYAGGTTVTSGSLFANNLTGSATGTGSVTVNSGARLGGTGAISGALTVNGTLAPGASIESLESGALTMNSGSTYQWETLDSSAVGADLMKVNGALSLTNVNLDLTLANLAAGTWAVNDKLTLFAYGGTAITGGFAGYLDDATYIFGLNEWVLNYNDTTAGSNYAAQAAGSSNFVTFRLNAVPEPSALGLVLVTCGGLGLRRRRRSA